MTKMANRLKCIRPTSRRIPRLLVELLDGKLAKRNREKDMREIEDHIKGCAFCKQVCVEHAHQVVTIPLLKAEAKKLGIPFKTFMAALEKVGDRKIAAGEFHRKQKHREK